MKTKISIIVAILLLATSVPGFATYFQIDLENGGQFFVKSFKLTDEFVSFSIIGGSMGIHRSEIKNIMELLSYGAIDKEQRAVVEDKDAKEPVFGEPILEEPSRKSIKKKNVDSEKSAKRILPIYNWEFVMKNLDPDAEGEARIVVSGILRVSKKAGEIKPVTFLFKNNNNKTVAMKKIKTEDFVIVPPEESGGGDEVAYTITTSITAATKPVRVVVLVQRF